MWKLGASYTCNGRIVRVGDPNRIESVSDNHLPGGTNNDVKILKLSRMNLGILPVGVGSFFPNLEGYESFEGGLNQLTRENFIDLPNLRAADLFGNRYTEVGNIFVNNSKLFALSFVNSPLQHVSLRTFDNLKSLQSLHAFDAGCFNKYVDTRSGVLQLISEFIRNCPPSWRMMEEDMAESEKLNQQTDGQIAERTNPLVLTVQAHETRIYRLEKFIEILEDQNESIKTQNQLLQKQLQEFKNFVHQLVKNN
jgi:hypothetical protein